MEIKKKHIIAIDFLLVVGSLVTIMLLVGYSRPLVIAPFDNENTTNGAVLFEFAKADKILIDDNIDFSSPDEINVENNLVVNLKPGVYYWKVIGIRQSEVRKLTILSEIGLKLKENNGTMYVVNSGNTELNVDIYDNLTLVGNITLGIDESKNVSGSLFIGGENE